MDEIQIVDSEEEREPERERAAIATMIMNSYFTIPRGECEICASLLANPINWDAVTDQ